MKKIILLALTTVILAGCSNRKYTKVDGEYVVIIDSCEYFVFNTRNDIGYSHKGNCRYCQERRQKELEELVIKLKEK